MATVPQSRSRSRGRGTQDREGPSFLDDLLAMAGSLASRRKEHASAQLEDLAEGLRQFSDALPSIPAVKTYAETAADSLEDLASYVVDSDLPDIVADARDFARRHPLATFGGSVAAGLIVTQIVHSRAQSMRSAVRTRRQRRSSRNGAGEDSGNEAES